MRLLGWLLGPSIEASARQHDPRWSWRDGGMEWRDGFDLIYVPFRSALRHWRKGNWCCVTGEGYWSRPR